MMKRILVAVLTLMMAFSLCVNGEESEPQGNHRFGIDADAVEKIEVSIRPMYLQYYPDNEFVIEDKDDIEYIMWLFDNVKWEATGRWVFDIGEMCFSFINEQGEEICSLDMDMAGDVFWRTPAGTSHESYTLDFEEAQYIFQKLYTIPYGKTEGDMLSAPSGWSKDLIEAAVDKNLIPSLQQTGYTASISRVDVCTIAEKFLFEYMGDDNIISYYEKFYDYLWSGDDADAVKKELKENMSEEEFSQYNEMMLLVKENRFDDYWDKGVVLLRTLGIVDGKTDNNFCPYDLVTREEMAKILSNLWHYLNPDSEIEIKESCYKDCSEISDWAKVYVDEMSSVGILKGDYNGSFAPKRHMSKEEVVITLMRVFEVTDK